MNIWNIWPDENKPNISSTTENSNEQHDKPDFVADSGAEYYDVDASQLNRRPFSGKVPWGYWFHQRLITLNKNEAGIDMMNGANWEEQKFTKNDVESAIQISIKDPALPDGDYTIEQSVLIDETTEKAIAYRTIYYFFDKNTMDFQNSFSVFYFANKHFKLDELESLKNVSRNEGEINISGFAERTNVHVKLPYVRKLVFVENGISIVVEAEADIVMDGSVVDEEKTLVRYKQTDKQLIGMMKSLIG